MELNLIRIDSGECACGARDVMIKSHEQSVHPLGGRTRSEMHHFDTLKASLRLLALLIAAGSGQSNVT